MEDHTNGSRLLPDYGPRFSMSLTVIVLMVCAWLVGFMMGAWWGV
jgi:hypothetical protein